MGTLRLIKKTLCMLMLLSFVAAISVTSVSAAKDGYGGYDKKSEGYGKMSEGYGKMSEGYGKKSEGYGKMSERYGKRFEGYGKKSEGYGEKSEGCGKRFEGYGKKFDRFDGCKFFDWNRYKFGSFWGKCEFFGLFGKGFF